MLTIHVKHPLTANLAQQGVFPQSAVVKRFGGRSISSDELEQSSILGPPSSGRRTRSLTERLERTGGSWPEGGQKY